MTFDVVYFIAANSAIMQKPVPLSVKIAAGVILLAVLIYGIFRFVKYRENKKYQKDRARRGFKME